MISPCDPGVQLESVAAPGFYPGLNSSGAGIQMIRGNTFLVTEDTLLNSFTFPMEADAGDVLTLSVWTSPTQGGTYTLVASAPTVVPELFDGVLADYNTGPLELLMVAGNYYALGAWWGADSARWTQGLASAPDPAWGQHVGLALASGRVTLPSTTALGTPAGAFGMEVHVNDEADADADGFLACAECDDAAAASYPGAPEICDGLDNDCDPSTQLMGLGFETPTPIVPDLLIEGGYWLGNIYWLESDVLLETVEMKFDAPEGTQVIWVLYSSAQELTGYTLEASTTTTIGANEADVLDWHTSGAFNLRLGSGKYWGIGAWSITDIEHEVDDGLPQIVPTPFGHMLVSREASSASGAPPAAQMNSGGPSWLAQRLNMNIDSDPDADEVAICEGDCDDSEPTAFPGNPEVACDMADNDCDASTTDCVGGLVITEIMNREWDNDADKDWIEVLNVSGASIDPGFWLLREGPNRQWYMPAATPIPDGGIALFAASADPNLNGGLPTPNLSWGSLIGLNTYSDELTLVSVLGETVDVVSYSLGAGFPVQQGSAQALDSPFLDAVSNDDGLNWCPSYAPPYGSGPDTGTPGAPNSPCTVFGSGAVAGDLVITEVMQSPSGDDENKEWFEVKNTTGSSIDLQGWTVSDDGGTPQIITESVVIPGNGYAVIGNTYDPLLNGGLAVDLALYTWLNLGNESDDVSIESPEGTEIDWVAWDDGATFPDPLAASMSLDPGSTGASLNDVGANWCESPAPPYGPEVDLGSPGAANPTCGFITN